MALPGYHMSFLKEDPGLPSRTNSKQERPSPTDFEEAKSQVMITCEKGWCLG